jgi:hypothetical protein
MLELRFISNRDNAAVFGHRINRIFVLHYAVAIKTAEFKKVEALKPQPQQA